MSVNRRSDVKIGMEVNIVMKEDQRSGELTRGYVERLLTNSPNHPRGIKVRLETGEIGRVMEVLSYIPEA